MSAVDFDMLESAFEAVGDNPDASLEARLVGDELTNAWDTLPQWKKQQVADVLAAAVRRSLS